jgi:uncharacterized protein YcfJ
MSKSSTAAILAISVAASAPALADHGSDVRYRGDNGQSDYDYAQVLDVDPLMREVRVVVPHQQCYSETRHVPVYDGRTADRPAAGPMILGGLLGAVIGHQIGDRRSGTRQVATVAGAVIGTAIGHDAAQRRAPVGGVDDGAMRPVESQRCEVREEERIEQQIDGYRVTYRYNGRTYTTQLPYDPGDRIRVRVRVEPQA